jgi:hypothetical protein
MLDFIAVLLRGGTTVKKRRKMAFKLLKMRAIYNILKLVKTHKNTNDKSHLTEKKPQGWSTWSSP